jgi:hypothetical protein
LKLFGHGLLSKLIVAQNKKIHPWVFRVSIVLVKR